MTEITLTALVTKNLDTVCYRGSAALADLARISQADVFDQEDNPEGLQRDLSKKHAAEAYDYVAKDKNPKLPRAYPEVLLNVRDKKVLKREVLAEVGDTSVVALTFDVDKILGARTTKVSRVDGNHRLIFGGGDGKEREPLDAAVPFQIHVGLTREQETSLFATINHEQKGLNTSHLHVLQGRITPEDIEIAKFPERVIALRLANDVVSPFHDLVHMGGSKAGAKEHGKNLPITFVALEHSVRRILKKAQYLAELEFDAQYGLIRSYWQAVKSVYPEAFVEPREYLLLKNLGVNTFGELAAMVIDRCLIAGKVEVGHMVPFLLAAKQAVDWHRDSRDVAGMSGNRAVLQLTGDMTKHLPKTAETYIEPGEAEEQQLALLAPEREEAEAA